MQLFRDNFRFQILVHYLAIYRFKRIIYLISNLRLMYRCVSTTAYHIVCSDNNLPVNGYFGHSPQVFLRWSWVVRHKSRCHHFLSLIFRRSYQSYGCKIERALANYWYNFSLREILMALPFAHLFLPYPILPRFLYRCNIQPPSTSVFLLRLLITSMRWWRLHYRPIQFHSYKWWTIGTWSSAVFPKIPRKDSP